MSGEGWDIAAVFRHNIFNYSINKLETKNPEWYQVDFDCEISKCGCIVEGEAEAWFEAIRTAREGADVSGEGVTKTFFDHLSFQKFTVDINWQTPWKRELDETHWGRKEIKSWSLIIYTQRF